MANVISLDDARETRTFADPNIQSDVSEGIARGAQSAEIDLEHAVVRVQAFLARRGVPFDPDLRWRVGCQIGRSAIFSIAALAAPFVAAHVLDRLINRACQNVSTSRGQR